MGASPHSDNGASTLEKLVRDRDDSTMNRYQKMWKSVPRALGFLIPNFAISTCGFIITVILVSLGAGTLLLLVGIPILAGGLMFSRMYGTQDLVRLKAAGMPAISQPSWAKYSQPRKIDQLKKFLINSSYWRYFLYVLLVFPLTIGTFILALLWSILALALPLYMCTFWLHPETSLGALLVPYLGGNSWTLNFSIYTFATAVFGSTLPWVLHGLMRSHESLATLLLRRTSNDALREQFAPITSAEGRTLRSLERDIHDGPQQQILRLQMDISSAQRRVHDDPTSAVELLAEAHERSARTLSELRRLSKGIVPPVLMDRGFSASIEALAERNTIPTTVENSLSRDVTPPLDHNVYFIVSELLTNITKHSDATRALIEIQEYDEYLHLRVSDTGKGGASIRTGGGLEGLQERVHGLGGSLNIHSPIGGPTAVNVLVPLP